MDENKELNTELQEEVIEEVTVEEEAVEEVAADVEEVVEEATLYSEEEQPIEVEEPKSKTGLVFTVLALVASIVIVALALVTSIKGNKYNDMGYIDIYGLTVQDLADAEGVSLEEYLEIYNLPADMPADTNSNAAENMMPVSVAASEATSYIEYLKELGILPKSVSEFEFFKLVNGMPAEVTESTPLGEARGMVKLKYIWESEEDLAKYKEMYGLDESVTLETEYKDIQNAVDNYKKKQFEEQKAMEEQIRQQLQQMAEEEKTDADAVPAE